MAKLCECCLMTFVIMVMLVLIIVSCFHIGGRRVELFRWVSPYIKGKLLYTYCIVWYGRRTQQIYSAAAASVETHWRISFRGPLLSRTRSISLLGLAGSLSFNHRRESWLLETVMGSINPAVQYMIRRSAANTTGAIDRNLYIEWRSSSWRV